ncbi:hypothetical protein LCGC14_3061030 [marine sediment metagenome]|uniref:Uncharacterized protein n=1 Tax=marine sediment metagenome TaxID=412755 RepID=A0A0F8WJF7_9ZZZZ
MLYYRTDACECVCVVIGRLRRDIVLSDVSTILSDVGGRWWPSSAYKDAHCGLVRQRVIKYEIFAQ